MSKAYDRVEWPFIQDVLSKFGFPSPFSNLIMACVSSVSFSFNINGQVSSHVTPTRGLLQGDPISPYIFVMCAEVLSSMIRKYVMEGHIHGVKVCRGAPEISHLFFADDNIFFTRSLVKESCRLKSIFTRYCQASGQGFAAALAILITGASQSRQHGKSEPSLFDVGSGRISIVIVNTL
uniref:Ribonuclease H n=1 Tax=Tanacetum cinerariifolium TaxID=118510 RepID=A0A6L2K2E4_TANCI|nr:ribonuclease H [Tanacetum cinerariifolium]